MPDVTPLAGLPPALTLHLGTALVALALGPLALYRRRRDGLHRGLGYVWVLAMALTALSSFALEAALLPIALGFGAIHLLSVWVLLQLALGIRDARGRRIAAHRARMAGLYWQGLAVAGLLTLLPGRTLNEMLFGSRSDLGLWAVAALGAVVLWVNLRGRLGAPAVP